MTMLPKTIYRFNAIPVKLNGIFHITKKKKKKSEFTWKHNRPWITKTVLGKRNGAGGINLPDFRLYYIDIVIKTVWYWHKNRNKCNKMESPEINPCTYGYLLFEKGVKNIQLGKDNLFNKWCWENWTATWKRMKLEHLLTPYIKINSTWIKALNERPETIKLRGKHRQNTWWHKSKQGPLWPTS